MKVGIVVMKPRNLWTSIKRRFPGKKRAQQKARAIARGYKPPAERPKIQISVNRLYAQRDNLELGAIRHTKGNDFSSRKKRITNYRSIALGAEGATRMKLLSRETQITHGRVKKGESTRLMLVKDMRGSVGLMAEFGDTAAAREIIPIVDGMIKAMETEQRSKTRIVPKDNPELLRELRATRTDLLKIHQAHNEEMARRRGNVRGLK